jgi:hypothetical protein
MIGGMAELAAAGYAIEIDGQLKTEFKTREGALRGAEEIKKRFALLRVEIYEVETKTREEIRRAET